MRSPSSLSRLAACLLVGVLLATLLPAHALAGDRWTPLGPPGGVVSVLFSSPAEPNVVWAGLARGGVYRSDDRGDTWRLRSDGLTAARVMAFDRAVDGTVYAATNRGVFRLPPGSLPPWEEASFGLPDSALVGDVKADPTVPGRVWVTVADEACDPTHPTFCGSWTAYRSDDGGASWVVTPGNLGFDRHLWVSDTTPPTVIATGEFGVLRSEPNGTGQEIHDDGLPNSPEFRHLVGHPTQPETLFGLVLGDPFRSFDSGRSWSLVPVGKAALGSPQVLALAPDTPGTVYLGTSGGVNRSEDEGDSWAAANAPPGNMRTESLAALPGGGLLAASDDNFGIRRSEDRGETWEQMDPEFLGSAVTAVSPDPQHAGRVLAADWNGILLSDESGQTWEPADGGQGGEPGQFVRNPENSDEILTYRFGSVLRSFDAGSTWETVGPHFIPDIYSMHATMPDDESDGVVYLTSGGSLWTSTDFGLTWTDRSGEICSERLLLAQPRADDVLIAGCLGFSNVSSAKSFPEDPASILRSTDGGTTWSVVYSQNTFLKSFEWSFSTETTSGDPGEPIFASLWDAAGTVWRSDDEGATWNVVESLQTDRVSTVLYDTRGGPGMERILAGTLDRGILVSTDQGTSWQSLNDGLVSARVLALEADPTDAERLWAGTGAGVHATGYLNVTELCDTAGRVLCLLGRFQAEVEWTDFDGNSGHGQAFPITDRTGGFWFFGPDNLEFTLKILDGRELNDHFWLFYGGLSTVSYTLTVTDLQTGSVQVIENESGGLLGAADTTAFFDPSGEPIVRPPSRTPADQSPIRLQDHRFEVQVRWQTPDGASGVAGAWKLSPDTAAFHFFSSSNLEIFAKVLDGRSINGRFWLFFTGLSDVAYDVEVTDTQTGESRVYSNEQGNFGGLVDIELF